MKPITVLLAQRYLDGMNGLIASREYASRSEIMRTAIRDLLKNEISDQSIDNKQDFKLIRRKYGELIDRERDELRVEGYNELNDFLVITDRVTKERHVIYLKEILRLIGIKLER